MINLLIILFITVIGVLFSLTDFSDHVEFNRTTYIFLIALLLLFYSDLRKWNAGLNSDTKV